jgi:hypothetical protein
MWYASLGIYGQECPSQECAKLEFCHPSGGGQLLRQPKTYNKIFLYQTLLIKYVCFVEIYLILEFLGPNSISKLIARPAPF